jgi:hypothetical protein
VAARTTTRRRDFRHAATPARSAVGTTSSHGVATRRRHSVSLQQQAGVAGVQHGDGSSRTRRPAPIVGTYREHRSSGDDGGEDASLAPASRSP